MAGVRFEQAYARLDPQIRPSFDQYLLDLSVAGGLVASYGKLDSVQVRVLTAEPDRVQVAAETNWVTALAVYPSTQMLTLVRRDGQWWIVPEAVDVTVPPEPLFQRSEVRWATAGRRTVVDAPKGFAEQLDRPAIVVRSARLVRHAGRYSVVGELANQDVVPADITVTAVLGDAAGGELSRYNAQEGLMHKLLPKEVTPFRVDFEGVAGAVLSDTLDLAHFKPGSFTPPVLTRPVRQFAVSAKAVTSQYDLGRSLTAQDLLVQIGPDGAARLTGRLLNTGTREATIPHVLLTYYDTRGQVAWVDHVYIRDAVRPQRTQPIAIPLTLSAELEPLADAPEQPEQPEQPAPDLIPLPPGLGFASLRVSVHAFEGGGL